MTRVSKLPLLWSLLVGCAALTVTRAAGPDPREIPLPVIPTDQAPMPGVNVLPDLPGLPPVLTMADGSAVTTAAQWQARRREMRGILEYYATGAIPPPPGNVVGAVLKSERELDGKVLYQLVHLSFGPKPETQFALGGVVDPRASKPSRSLGLDIAVFKPTDRPGPFPTFIFLSFFKTPGAVPLPLQPIPAAARHAKDALLPAPPADVVETTPSRPASPPPAPETPAQTAAAHAELFHRGYALVQFYYQDCGEDSQARNPDGSWAYRNTRFFPAYPRYDWGLTTAWAWGVWRCVDYCETQAFADKAKLIAIGHSRLGKATLIAGALDERIALSAPAGSGAGGTGAYRFNGERGIRHEGLDDVVRKFPGWFSPHLHEFWGHVDRLPFDQHWYIALTAPRPFITLEGTQDQFAEANATQQAWEAARPAYTLLGAGDKLGVNFAPHKHQLAPDDWTAVMDFADWQLRGMKQTRSFDSFPAR